MDMFDSNSLSDDGIQVTTPTQSQENSLLNEQVVADNNTSEEKSELKIDESGVKIPSNEAKQKNSSATTMKKDVFFKLNPSSFSLGKQSQEEKKGTEKKRKNRSRSTARRTLAKSAQSHLRDDDTPKRGRESGGTPPSAQQPSKIGKQGDLKTNKSHKPAVTSNETKVSATPVQQTEQSFGAKNDGEFSGSQSNVSAPPATKSQLPGTDSNQIEHMDTFDTVNTENDTETFASVVNNLCVAIVDRRSNDSILLMDQKRFDLLSSAMTDKIIEHAGKNMKLPAIEDSRFFTGTMRVRCANNDTRLWLEKYIPTLDRKKLWPGAKLVVINFRDMPKPYKFNVWFRGMKASAQDLFLLLERSNKGIITKSWSALAHEQKQDGTHMTIGVGQESFDVLRQKANTLYCGLGKAVFKMVHHCKANQAMLHSGVLQNDANRQDEEHVQT